MRRPHAGHASRLRASLPLVFGVFFGVGAPAEAQRSLAGDPQITYWELEGSTSERTVVVLHGGPAMSHDYMRPEWDRLAGTARVVFYDQRGCGQSGPAGSYAWSDHVEDLHRLIERVSPDAQVVLAGSSWGALLATLYVTRYPEDVGGMVLSGLPAPTMWRTEPFRFLPELELPPELEPFRAPEPPRFPGLTGRRPDRRQAAEDLRRTMELLDARFVADCPAVRAATTASLANAPDASIYGAEVPVLFFPDNMFYRSFFTAVAMPEVSGNVTTIVGGGHDPWFRTPDVFFGAVERFLTEVWDR
jgi:proline iminopeptidase